jgi:HK97 gp10 family phage protein
VKTVLPVFTLTPASKKFIERLKRATKELPKKEKKIGKLYAETAAKLMRDGIKKQEFNHPALTPEWKAKKAKRGLDPRTLMATKAFVDTIEAKPGTDGNYGVVADAKLSKIIEHGTKNQPPRPFIRPVMEKIGGAVDPKKAKELTDDLLGR